MAGDDKQLFIIRSDFSGGQNNRQHGSKIGDNQVTVLYNSDIGTPGQTRKRPGLTLIENLGVSAGTGLFGFEPSSGTNELMATYGSTLTGWQGSGSFVNRKADFASGTPVTMLKVGEQTSNDVLAVYMSGNNWFRMKQDHTFSDLGDTNTSPPLSEVATYYRNRWWVLKSDLLYWSEAFPADYSAAFDRTTNNYRINVGPEMALIPIRDQGIVSFGRDAVWAINPSVTPTATDKPEKLLDTGCVSGKTAVQVGDDILYLSTDGVRGLFRTVQDKIQSGTSYPLSYLIKDEVESISWAYVSKSCAVFFDNKYFLSIPVDASTYNNEVWVYYPASNAWMIVQGWNVAAWAKMKVNGEERLYAIDSTNGKVYQAWEGFSDNSTAINFQLESRKEDFGQPLITKTGGELKIRALSSGSYTITVYVSVDDDDYVTLGTINLAGNSPVLPVSLPFSLADSNIIEEQFHLDSLGPFRQIRFKLVHNDTNGNDEIIVYEVDVVTYADEYQSE